MRLAVQWGIRDDKSYMRMFRMRHTEETKGALIQISRSRHGSLEGDIRLVDGQRTLNKYNMRMTDIKERRNELTQKSRLVCAMSGDSAKMIMVTGVSD